MTNCEKYKEFLKDNILAFGVDKDGIPKSCLDILCMKCEFYGAGKTCATCRKRWLVKEDGTPSDQMTNEEVWNMALKIRLMDAETLNDIFSLKTDLSVFENRTPAYAKAAIDKWEKAKLIKVGDIVVHPKDKDRGVVTRVEGDYIVTLLDNGITASINKKHVKKTGEHVDMQAILDAVAPCDEV